MRTTARTVPSSAEHSNLEINRVIRDVLRQHVDDDSADAIVLQEHAHLMPVLGDRLKRIREMRAARQRVLRHSLGAAIDRSLDAACADEVRLLAEAMPDYDFLDHGQCGGQGVVYKARHRPTSRIVAIKVLLGGPIVMPQQRRRFEREAELLARLNHPNIVTLYDTGVVHGRHYLAMQFVQGLPIDDYVALHDLNLRAIVTLFATACRAVAHAHLHGIIHRDLKPSNILVDEAGKVHVCDFGLAKDSVGEDRTDVSVSMTMTGKVVGTLPYLSPEQVTAAAGATNGDAVAPDLRSDIYSLGVVLYELLTGSLPYEIPKDIVQARDNILHQRPPRLRDVGDAGPRVGQGITDDLEAVVARALSKEPHRRYQSADAFASDLEKFLRGDAVEAKADSRWYVLRKTARRYRIAIAITAAFFSLATGSAITGLYLWSQAVHARDNARSSATEAHDALNLVIGRVDDTVRDLAGGTAVSRDVLAELTGKLDRLIQRSENDPAMRTTLATLHERRGDIALGQSHRDEAKGHYAAFASIANELRGVGDLDRCQVDRLRARAHQKLSHVSDDPGSELFDSIQILSALPDAGKDRSEVDLDLASVRVDLARHFYSKGQHPAAREQIDKTLQDIESNPPTRPDPKWDRLRASALDCASDIYIELGRSDLALKLQQEALAIRERLSSGNPTNLAWIHERVLALVKLGTLYQDAGATDDALDKYEFAVSAGESLAKLDNTRTGWTFTLLRGYIRFARLLIDTGDWRRANMGIRKKMLACAAELRSKEPENFEFMRGDAYARMTDGLILLKAGEAPRACERFEECLALCNMLYNRDPASLDAMSDLAMAHDYIGMCLGLSGSTLQSIDHYQRAAEIRARLLGMQPNVTSRVTDAFLSKSKLVSGFLRLRTPEADRRALEYCCQCCQILAQLEESGKLAGLGSRVKQWTTELAYNQRLIARHAIDRIANSFSMWWNGQVNNGPQEHLAGR